MGSIKYTAVVKVTFKALKIFFSNLNPTFSKLLNSRAQVELRSYASLTFTGVDAYLTFDLYLPLY